ncbi:MAG: endonuclease [Bacilli bacterium]|nr:endonuclease [Bacilli bacterium]
MKKCFRYILFLLLLLLTACASKSLDEVAASLLSEVDLENVKESLDLPKEIDGVKISWFSSNPYVLSHEGEVTRKTVNEEIDLYATLNYKGKTLSITFNIFVPKAEKLIEPLDPTDPKDPTDPVDPGITLPAYYDGFEGLEGVVLKAFLHDLIDDHTVKSYAYAKEALLETDKDPNNPNNFILFYTGRSVPRTHPVGSSGDYWNREHVWAKSHGDFENTIANSDLHNLRPTDASVNGVRGNLDFDEGGNKVIDTYGEGSSFCYVDSDSFEPRNEVKGDVARILFYMAVRYEGDKGSEPDLELNDRVNNGKTSDIGYLGKLSILLIWNLEDPVDDFERNRNEVIYGIQGNRNPFIDYPGFAQMIWG